MAPRMDSITRSFIAASLENLVSVFAIWSTIYCSLFNLRMRKVLTTPSLLINGFPAYLAWRLIPSVFCSTAILNGTEWFVTKNRYYQIQSIIRDFCTDIFLSMNFWSSFPKMLLSFSSFKERSRHLSSHCIENWEFNCTLLFSYVHDNALFNCTIMIALRYFVVVGPLSNATSYHVINQTNWFRVSYWQLDRWILLNGILSSTCCK